MSLSLSLYIYIYTSHNNDDETMRRILFLGTAGGRTTYTRTR